MEFVINIQPIKNDICKIIKIVYLNKYDINE